MKDLQLPSTSSSSYPNSMYTFKNPRPQNFDIPFPIIKYIIKNPTGKSWKNLIKTCKYFFLKYPYFPIDEIDNYDIFDIVIKMMNDRNGLKSKKLCSKLWLYDSLKIKCLGGSQTRISSDITKICIFGLQKLDLQFQDLSFEEYQILTCSGTIKDLSLFMVTVKYSNGEKLTADKIFETLPNLERLHLDTVHLKLGSITKIVEILPSLPNLRKLKLVGLDESFDFAAFSDYLMKNETIFIELHFDNLLPDAYKRMLENFMDNVLENPLKRIPYILFFGMNTIKYEKYVNMFYTQIFSPPFSDDSII